MWRNVEHGDRCDCMLLARAVGAPPASIDFIYCERVLQRHWRLACNHGCHVRPAKVTPRLPPLDIHDPVHALLLANAPSG